MLLLIAGHDSTVNTIAHCVLTLLRNPESIELLREKPELIPKAIEEVLRLQSAVQFFPSRSVTADIEVGGTVIPAGSAVHLLYGAANRDPKRFPDPDEVRHPAAGQPTRGLGPRSAQLRRRSTGPPGGQHRAWRRSYAASRTPGWSSTRRPTGVNQVFRGPLHLEVEFDRIKD